MFGFSTLVENGVRVIKDNKVVIMQLGGLALSGVATLLSNASKREQQLVDIAKAVEEYNASKQV